MTARRSASTPTHRCSKRRQQHRSKNSRDPNATSAPPGLRRAFSWWFSCHPPLHHVERRPYNQSGASHEYPRPKQKHLIRDVQPHRQNLRSRQSNALFWTGCRMAKKSRQLLPHKEQGLDLLDLATGTADQALFLCDQHPDTINKALGMDLSEGMLSVGREKIKARNMAHKITLKTGDACNLPLEDESFDAITISFGIRNVPDVPKALREMHRVLRPGRKSHDTGVLHPEKLNRSSWPSLLSTPCPTHRWRTCIWRQSRISISQHVHRGISVRTKLCQPDDRCRICTSQCTSRHTGHRQYI